MRSKQVVIIVCITSVLLMLKLGANDADNAGQAKRTTSSALIVPTAPTSPTAPISPPSSSVKDVEIPLAKEGKAWMLSEILKVYDSSNARNGRVLLHLGDSSLVEKIDAGSAAETLEFNRDPHHTHRVLTSITQAYSFSASLDMLGSYETEDDLYNFLRNDVLMATPGGISVHGLFVTTAASPTRVGSRTLFTEGNILSVTKRLKCMHPMTHISGVGDSTVKPVILFVRPGPPEDDCGAPRPFKLNILPEFLAEPDVSVVKSRLASTLEMKQPWMFEYLAAMKEGNRYHRKQWEFASIARALDHMKVLGENTKGLGFAVGREPLASYFVERGSRMTVSDMPTTGNEAKAAAWSSTGQHTADVLPTWNGLIVSKKKYEKMVDFIPINMNEIPTSLNGKYDFCYSAGALEHVGGVKKSFQFIVNSLNTLKPGGVAVHTTEVSLSNTDKCLEVPGASFFTRKEIEKWVKDITEQGHTVLPLEWAAGTETYVDRGPPGQFSPDWHMRLLELDTIHTSNILIIRKKEEED